MKGYKRPKRDTFKLGWPDFCLSALASCLAVFSAGMGLRVQEVYWFLGGWIILGTLVSYGLSRVIPEKHTWVGGLLYSMMAIASVMYSQPLNSILPMGGFPYQLIVAASLAWMLTFGSFLTWRDSTIVFQAVPSIALFGLVGAWDTFAGAPFAFFGFLLCFATLFARAHGRVMMLQAEESGYAGSGSEPLAGSSGESVYESLKRGPWHWMAGPEWALGSAAVIVLLSVLGAPLLQSSVQGVAGFVKIQVPNPPPALAAAAAAFRAGMSGSVTVGNGPSVGLTMKPVLAIKMFSLGAGARAWTRPMYLRTRTYDTYTGRGWQVIHDFSSLREMQASLDDPNSFLNASRNAIDPYRRLQFDIEFYTSPSDGVPIPGDLDYMSNGRRFVRRSDGSVRFMDDTPRTSTATGVVRISDDESDPKKAIYDVPPVYHNMAIGTYPERVRLLAVSIAASAKTDYEKAKAIQHEIERRCVYDLSAEAVPEGSDPVEWFLFTGKKGYCDLFASAMTVMARAAGLPARYVTGYYPALEKLDSENRWILHESEAHAWCEIFFEGKGWVPFDATEGAQERGRPTSDIPMMERGWFRAMVVTVAGLAIILAPVMINSLLRKRRIPKDKVRAEVGRQYGRFVRGMERASGKPKRPNQTPEEYFEGVASLLPHAEVVREVNNHFVIAMYAPPETLNGLVGTLRDEVSAALKTLKAKRKP